MYKVIFKSLGMFDLCFLKLLLKIIFENIKYTILLLFKIHYFYFNIAFFVFYRKNELNMFFLYFLKQENSSQNL